MNLKHLLRGIYLYSHRQIFDSLARDRLHDIQHWHLKYAAKLDTRCLTLSGRVRRVVQERGVS